MVALAATLVFAFQNVQSTAVSFLGLSGHFPLGLALVAAPLLGGLVVFFQVLRHLSDIAVPTASRTERVPG
jgi:uncharacterized integral membrane protein